MIYGSLLFSGVRIVWTQTHVAPVGIIKKKKIRKKSKTKQKIEEKTL